MSTTIWRRFSSDRCRPSFRRGHTAVVSSELSERSFAELTDDHLRHLAELAAKDHLMYTRDKKRPRYRDRRILVVLAQGAAEHYLEGKAGVKDLDVWTFYAEIPGERFPGYRRKTEADFGPSVFGRQLYEPDLKRRELRRWKAFTGRRIDFIMKGLPVSADASDDEVFEALRAFLNAAPTRSQVGRTARKAMICISPKRLLGTTVWDPECDLA